MNRETTNMRNWMLDSRLAGEALAQNDLTLCRILLRNEERFPWIVLVPRRDKISESFDLSPEDRAQLWVETDRVARRLKDLTNAKKINIAAFGNMVPQLHIHIVARFEEDPVWPGSAIGWDAAQPYSDGVPPFWEELLDALLRNER